MVANTVALERAVHDGKLLQGDDCSAHEERHKGKARAVPVLESALLFVAQIDDASHVYFEHAVNVSARPARFDHALRDDLAHVGHRNEFAWNGGGRRGWGLPLRRDCGWSGRWSSRRSRGAALYEIHNILLSNPAAGARAIYFAEIDIVLAG